MLDETSAYNIAGYSKYYIYIARFYLIVTNYEWIARFLLNVAEPARYGIAILYLAV